MKMAIQTISRSPPPAHDDLDDLFDYEPNLDDIFNINNESSVKEQSQARRSDGNGTGGASGGLGIDEEIVVVNKRQPVAKLDDVRLLSDLGIPKLRKIAKKRKNFKGKGHEFSDISKMLATYQLWLDELYPRAKFNDGLAIIEKLGHTKRIQIMRKQWIDECKPHSADEELVRSPEGNASTNDAEQATETPIQNSSIVREDIGAKQASPDTGAVNLEDPDEDELDALLAEDVAGHATSITSTKSVPVQNGDFDDDEEAMADISDMW